MGMINSYYCLAMYLIYNAFGIYVIFKFNKIFFDRTNGNKKIELLAYIVYFVATSIVYLSWNLPILTVVTNLILCFVVNCVYNSNQIKRLVMSILINAIFFLSESISYIIMIKGNLKNIEFVLSFISTLLTFVLVLILENFINSKKTERLEVVHWAAIFTVPAISIYIAFVLVSSSYLFVQTSVGILGLLSINFLIFYLYDEIAEAYEIKYEKALLQQKNKAYLNELDLIKTSNESLRSLKHDLKNHILTLESMAENNETEKIQNYLGKMQSELSISGTYSCTHNYSLDSILNYKLQKSKELGAEVKANVNFPQNLEIEQFDITIVLGNLLDNAIESIQECKDKFIELNINVDRGVLFINIKNSTIRPDNAKALNFWRTSKSRSENHGFGLKQIKKTIDEYNGGFDIFIKNNICEANIMMYIKNRKISNIC